jgi:hypothetical protein
MDEHPTRFTTRRETEHSKSIIKLTLDLGNKYNSEKKERKKLEKLSKKPVSSAFENKVEKAFRKEFNEVLQKEYLDQKFLEQEEKVNDFFFSYSLESV